MSAPEVPATTDIERLIAAQEKVAEALNAQTAAINGLGQNVQWVIDRAQGIFEMFSNPAFMSMLPQMMGGMPDGSSE